MKSEMKTNHLKKITIPDEIMEQTRLGEAEALRVYGNDGCLILVSKTPTVGELCMAAELLVHVCVMLCSRLVGAVKQREEKSRTIKIPDELLEMSGIPKGAPLDICAGEGELYISMVDEEDDLAEALPNFLWDFFKDNKLDLNVLRHMLESEEQLHE